MICESFLLDRKTNSVLDIWINGSYFHIVIIPKDCKRNQPYDKNRVYKHSSTAILTLLKLYRISNCYNYECYFLQCLIVNWNFYVKVVLTTVP